MHEKKSDEELLRWAEWLIFDAPRTPDANDLHDAIDEMKRRGTIDIEKWLVSLPTDAEHKAEAARKMFNQILENFRKGKDAFGEEFQEGLKSNRSNTKTSIKLTEAQHHQMLQFMNLIHNKEELEYPPPYANAGKMDFSGVETPIGAGIEGKIYFRRRKDSPSYIRLTDIEVDGVFMPADTE